MKLQTSTGMNYGFDVHLLSLVLFGSLAWFLLADFSSSKAPLTKIVTPCKEDEIDVSMSHPIKKQKVSIGHNPDSYKAENSDEAECSEELESSRDEGKDIFRDKEAESSVESDENSDEGGDVLSNKEEAEIRDASYNREEKHLSCSDVSCNGEEKDLSLSVDKEEENQEKDDNNPVDTEDESSDNR
jgi:hypothetical protein